MHRAEFCFAHALGDLVDEVFRLLVQVFRAVFHGDDIFHRGIPPRLRLFFLASRSASSLARRMASKSTRASVFLNRENWPWNSSDSLPRSPIRILPKMISVVGSGSSGFS